MKFESTAEKAIYPIIHTLAIQYNYKFEYQKKFGSKSGGYSSSEEWQRRNDPDYDYDDAQEPFVSEEFEPDDDWVDTSWESEKYRVDFILTNSINKIIIEIDGEQYHQDLEKEKQRDSYFKRLGFEVLHIPAVDALKKQLDVKYRILRMITTKPMVVKPN